MITEEKKTMFQTLGYEDKLVKKRLEEIINTVFFGDKETSFYYEENDMAYVLDTGNYDVRTEGMSYAMMVFVQLDMQENFDKIWKFVMKYMYLREGENKGYFAWSVDPKGRKNAYGPAPDGEEFFAMALFFAAHRWGNGKGIHDYEDQAKTLLSVCVHKGENGEKGHPMWHPKNKLIKFVPGLEFSDPSYHLPQFYKLFALWGNEEDRTFWEEASKASIKYIKQSCHPITGLSSEYADYEGKPINWHGHDYFYSDSYRVAANIGLYHLWNHDDPSLCECAHRIQTFFHETPDAYEYAYEIDGTRRDEKVLHPVGLLATNAMASLATDGEVSRQCVETFFKTPLREGGRRYFDNFLYVFTFLALSGNYKIW